MKAFKSFIIFLLLQGCGTIKTNVQEDTTISAALTQRKTHCTSIPRIYSGVAYNWCTLNAQPTNSKGWSPTLESTIIDIALSGIADTVILPYTLIQHLQNGPNQFFDAKH